MPSRRGLCVEIDDRSPRGDSLTWPGRIAAALVPDENPAGAIYGTITAGALLAAETSQRATLVRDAGGVALALVLFWLSHAYANSLGDRLEGAKTGAPLSFPAALAHEGSIVKGSFLPLGVLLAAWAVGASVTVAVTAALISAAVLLVVLETVAAVRISRNGTNVFVHVAVGTILGLGILGVKIVLH
jgi:hypothetical protein